MSQISCAFEWKALCDPDRISFRPFARVVGSHDRGLFSSRGTRCYETKRIISNPSDDFLFKSSYDFASFAFGEMIDVSCAPFFNLGAIKIAK